MKSRPQGSIWSIYPDECSGIKWDVIRDCLKNRGKKQQNYSLFVETYYYKVSIFEQKKSDSELPIQISDLFAGLAVFSKTNFESYQAYVNSVPFN